MSSATSSASVQCSAKRRRTGILGGSFDPVHTGHVWMAQDALELFELDRVLLIPCARPPHKGNRPLAAARHRLAMLKSALAGLPGLEVCDIEVRRGGRSYSIDTVGALIRRYPEDDFFFIIGDDSLIDLPVWFRIDDLLELCEFITLARPGVKLGPRAPRLPPAWRRRLLELRREGHGFNVSSTEVRRRVAEALSIRYLVPDPVMFYMESQGLYRRRPVVAGGSRRLPGAAERRMATSCPEKVRKGGRRLS